MGSSRFEDGVNSETWLYMRLTFAGVEVGRFPALAYVTCEPREWLQHFKSKAEHVKHRWSKSFPCRDAGFRFPQEHKAATKFAECVASLTDVEAGGVSSLWQDTTGILECE